MGVGLMIYSYIVGKKTSRMWKRERRQPQDSENGKRCTSRLVIPGAHYRRDSVRYFYGHRVRGNRLRLCGVIGGLVYRGAEIEKHVLCLWTAQNPRDEFWWFVACTACLHG